MDQPHYKGLWAVAGSPRQARAGVAGSGRCAGRSRGTGPAGPRALKAAAWGAGKGRGMGEGSAQHTVAQAVTEQLGGGELSFALGQRPPARAQPHGHKTGLVPGLPRCAGCLGRGRPEGSALRAGRAGLTPLPPRQSPQHCARLRPPSPAPVPGVGSQRWVLPHPRDTGDRATGEGGQAGPTQGSRAGRGRGAAKQHAGRPALQPDTQTAGALLPATAGEVQGPSGRFPATRGFHTPRPCLAADREMLRRTPGVNGVKNTLPRPPQARAQPGAEDSGITV